MAERDLEDPPVRPGSGAGHLRQASRRQPAEDRSTGRNPIELDEVLRIVAVREPGEAARIEHVVAAMRRVVGKPHPDPISRGTHLLDSRIDALRANVLAEHPDHFGRIEVIADQPRRLETIQKL